MELPIKIGTLSVGGPILHQIAERQQPGDARKRDRDGMHVDPEHAIGAGPTISAGGEPCLAASLDQAAQRVEQEGPEPQDGSSTRCSSGRGIAAATTRAASQSGV